jgi:UDP:flavonoid glycosyltransferase YjiC (YdhE family)
MKIGIQTWGSRGDVNPWIALGQGLQKSGHEVIFYYTCFTNLDFNNYSREGLEIKSTKEFCSDPEIYHRVPYKKVHEMELQEGNTYILQEVYSLFNHEIVLAGKLLCETCDLIIISNLLYQLPSLAEKYKVPVINIHVDYNFASISKDQDYLDSAINEIYLERINKFRETLMLPPISNVRTQVFCSSVLNLVIFSKIFGEEMESWGINFKVCGFLEMESDSGQTLSNELKFFIGKGAPPVFFSLGSLSFFEENILEVLDLFIKAIRLSGCRAIIQADWENITYALPVDLEIFPVSFVPHNLVFSRCLCAVHHGGAGTTHSTLVNGCPSIVVAYGWDQFIWGHRLIELGVAPGILKRKSVDEIQLAGSIRNIMVNPEFKNMAENCRRKMKRENGVKKAVKIIEEYAMSCKEYAH